MNFVNKKGLQNSLSILQDIFVMNKKILKCNDESKNIFIKGEQI